MDELIQEILKKVADAGGSLSYKDLYESTDFEKRRMLPNAFKALQAQGLLTQSVGLVDGKVLHQYHRVRG